MFYMMLKLITILLIYKIISIGKMHVTAASIIIPLWFVTGDVIAEIYGYNISKQIIWAALIFQFVFVCICTIFVNLPSPAYWVQQNAYNQIFNNLPRVVVSSFIAIVSSAFLNAYAVSKWKILLNGKLFWLRSLGASIIGEATFVIIALSLEFTGLVPFTTLLQLILVSFATKIAINPILVIPSTIIMSVIKKIENVDIYEYDLEFNPLKIKIGNSVNDTVLQAN